MTSVAELLLSENLLFVSLCNEGDVEGIVNGGELILPLIVLMNHDLITGVHSRLRIPSPFRTRVPNRGFYSRLDRIKFGTIIQSILIQNANTSNIQFHLIYFN